MKKYSRLLSAAVMIGALGGLIIYIVNDFWFSRSGSISQRKDIHLCKSWVDYHFKVGINRTKINKYNFVKQQFLNKVS